MARLGLAVVILCVAGMCAAADGYEFETAKKYVTRIIDKASTIVGGQRTKFRLTYPTKESRVPFVCTRDGLFSDPEECGRYIRCHEGALYNLPCPQEGHHFNNRTGQCEQPCDAGCDRTMACECGWENCASTVVDTTADGTESDSEMTTEESPAFSCPRDGRYSHPFRCDKYVHCVGGKAELRDCPALLHFAKLTGRCESPCVAQCDPPPSCSSNSEMSPKSEDSSPQRRPPSGYGDCERDGLFPDPGTCSGYIHCSNGRMERMPCPRGLHFSPLNLICERPCEAKCDTTMAEECRWDDEPENDFDVCRRRPYHGPCSRNVTRWYFDIDQGNCRPFIYGGCQGNGNNFKSRRECSFKCLRRGVALKESKPEFTCIGDGVYPNPDEPCTTYIRCTNGESRVMICARGLHFSERTGKCETPCDARCDAENADKYDCDHENVESSDKMVRQTHTHDGLYPNPDDCGSYVECIRGWCYTRHCPMGQHYDPHTTHCEDPCDAHCDPDMAEQCHWEEHHLLKTTSESSYPRPTTNRLTCNCTKDGRYPVLDNCNVYAECKGGKAKIISCPIGSHYSTDSLECELYCDAHCDPALAEGCLWDTTKYGILKQGFVHDHDGLYPNLEDCGSYIQCYRGRCYVKYCPRGQHFDAFHMMCDDPCEAHCDPDIAYSCHWDDYDRRFPYPYKSAPLAKYNHRCENDGEFRDYDGCATYIVCKDRQAYRMPCPPGQHFSIMTFECEAPCYARCDPHIAKECGWPDDEKSPSDKNPTMMTSSERQEDVSPRMLKQPIFDFTCMGNGLYENEGDCGTFIQCTGGNAYLISCARNKHFNARTKKCESPCTAGCEPGIEDQEECKEERLLSTTDSKVMQKTIFKSNPNKFPFCEYEGQRKKDPKDCSSYFLCQKGWVERKHCPTGQHFSEGTTECEELCDARCDSTLDCDCDEPECNEEFNNYFHCPVPEGRFSHYPDCVSYYHCEGDVATLKRCPRGTAFDDVKQRCVTEYEAKCVYHCQEPDAVYPYEKDCLRYIDCVNGVAKLERCPPGTAFDPRQKDCVTVENGRCPISDE